MDEFFSSLRIFNFLVSFFFFATEIKKVAARGAAAEKKYQFTFNGTSVFGESEEKFHLKPSKHFSIA